MGLTAAAKQTYRSHPITSFAGFDTVADILRVLQQLEQGYFRSAAILADSMGRDDRIDAVIRTLIDELVSSPVDCIPSDDRRKSAKIAEMIGGVEDGPGEWDRMFPEGTLGEVIRSGLELNFGLAKIGWYKDGGMLWPRLETWHTQFVRWDQTSETYKVMTADKSEITLPRMDLNPIGDGTWLIFTPFGYQYAWRRATIRSLAGLYMRRMWINRDWPRYNEIHGMPGRKAIVPADKGTGPESEAFFEDVANMGSEPTIKCPQDENGTGYDVELLEAVAKTYETFKDAKTDVNTDIAVLVLGQNLTTEAPGGGLGGGGEISTHRQVELKRLRRFASIATAIRDQVLIPWAIFNFGDASLAPRPVYQIAPPDDDKGEADTLKAVGDAILSLKNAGVAVDERATAEEFGVQQLTVEEEAARKAVQAEEARARAEAAQQFADVAAGKDGGAPAARKGNAAGAEAGAAAAAQMSGDMSKVVARRQYAGLPIAIENPRGTMREWTDAAGAVTGKTLMHNDYGFIQGHVGADGEEIDVYLGPDEDASDVHVVHQHKAPGYTAYDEDKCMLGFGSANAARTAYAAHRNDGEKAIGGMSSIPVDRFKAKLARRTGTGRIRAAAAPASVDSTFVAIMKLADASAAHLKGKKKRTEYQDRLTEKAIALGSRALAADLAVVGATVADAKSFDDLRKKIVAVYKDKMDPAELARIVQRTRLMANLSGRLQVQRDR